MSPCLIIAEAGVNHNGSLDLALKLVDAAAECGADVVKFQTFRSELLATQKAEKADYQKRNRAAGNSQRDMLKALELPMEAYFELVRYCRSRGIDFLSSPFDVDSARFLVNDLGVKSLKLGSGELTNALLLLEVARLGVPLLLSTGMSTLGEVEVALSILAFGYLAASERPHKAAFARAFCSQEGQVALRANVRLFHCTTEYPAPAESVNLKAIDTLKTSFGLPVGYSDHTMGTHVSIAAVARGAGLIEKHLTLDRTLPGPDHQASLNPVEFASMVKGIRMVEAALGDGIKAPHSMELKNRDIARKSLVAARAISKGTPFDLSNMTAKRPGNGVSAFEYWDWLGRVASRDYDSDTLIES